EVRRGRRDGTCRLLRALTDRLAERGEVELEDLVEGRQVDAALDHGRAQDVLHELARSEAGLAERGERVERLGRRDAEAMDAQQRSELEDARVHDPLSARALCGDESHAGDDRRGGGALPSPRARGQWRTSLSGAADPVDPAGPDEPASDFAFAFWRATKSRISFCAFRMSPSYLKIVESVSFTDSSPSVSTFSSASARAQSSVSLMLGDFLRSSLRTAWTMETTSAARASRISGTLSLMISSSCGALGKSMKRWRQRRLSASDTSRVLLLVRI